VGRGGGGAHRVKPGGVHTNQSGGKEKAKRKSPSISGSHTGRKKGGAFAGKETWGGKNSSERAESLEKKRGAQGGAKRS